MQMLRSALEQTLSPVGETRKSAEKFLESLAAQPNYVLSLLQVLENGSEQRPIRLSAALVFKNFIKNNWDPEKQGCIPQNEKNIVKEHLVELMCRMPESIQKQLIEALTTIGEYDFPAQWENLLLQLVQKLQTEQDWQVRIGVLMTANTIFKRFRNVFKSDSLFRELKHCLEFFQVRTDADGFCETCRVVCVGKDSLLLFSLLLLWILRNHFFTFTKKQAPPFDRLVRRSSSRCRC